MNETKNKEIWIPRCRKCGEGRLTFYPSQARPTMNVTAECADFPKVYCDKCHAIFSLSELPSLYVKL